MRNQKHDTPDDIDTWEELSSQVLNAIKCLIDALRSAPYPRERVIDKPGKLACHNEADFSLTSHFRSVGIFDVVQQLNALRSQSNEAQISDTDSAIIDERHQVLHDVIFPLMIHLQNHCHRVLSFTCSRALYIIPCALSLDSASSAQSGDSSCAWSLQSALLMILKILCCYKFSI